MNSELQRQQHAFANALRDASDCSILKATPQGGPARFHVYSDAYRIRLGEALRENYPVLASVLGDAGFADLAAEFLHHNPSRTASIRWFGSALADFVAGTADVLPHPALLDLIRMEWALNTAFDAADATPVSVNDMLTVAPEAWPALRFRTHPSLRLLSMQWNVEPLWAALSADSNAETAAPEALDHHLLVWRVGHQTQWRSVEMLEAQLLSALMNDSSFAELCTIALESKGEEAAATAAGYLRVWVEAGLLAEMMV